MSAVAQASVAREPIGLTCTCCGNDGTAAPIRFLASVTASAEIVSLRRGGLLELVGPVVRSDAGYPQLGCDACGDRFGLPPIVRGISWRMER